jgi:uncharacterized protein (TIGR02145 family)
MADEFANILKTLISIYGIDILDDANKCEYLLLEHSVRHKRDIKLFIEILENNFYKKLQTSLNRNLDKKQIARLLYRERGIDMKLAEEAVNCLCYAAFGEMPAETSALPAKKENTALTLGVLLAFLLIALIVTFILNSVSKTVDFDVKEIVIEYIPFTDNRDNQTYKTVVIGSLTWFAENLNYKAGNSWCYDNDEFNCKKYGRLYDWNTARVVCPSGWHLPSHAEWNDMVSTIGSDAVGKKLKSKNGWNRIGRIGTDEYGFCALPGGRRFASGNFRLIGEAGNWWTSTECSNLEAYYRYMNANIDDVGESNYYRKIMGFSVRCVKN